jgi:hypothetical protein
MSLLEQQMQELKLKQRKVALLSTFLELIEAPTKTDEKITTAEAEADQEVISDLQSFIQSRIDSIENGTPAPTQEELPEGAIGLSQEEIGFVKEMVARAGERGITANNNVYAEEEEEEAPGPMARHRQHPRPRPKAPQPAPVKPKGQKDLVMFARENSHMHGKRVIVNAKQGKVGGIVTGVAGVGQLMVTTDTGHDVPVSLENITLE